MLVDGPSSACPSTSPQGSRLVPCEPAAIMPCNTVALNGERVSRSKRTPSRPTTSTLPRFTPSAVPSSACSPGPGCPGGSTSVISHLSRCLDGSTALHSPFRRPRDEASGEDREDDEHRDGGHEHTGHHHAVVGVVGDVELGERHVKGD